MNRSSLFSHRPAWSVQGLLAGSAMSLLALASGTAQAARSADLDVRLSVARPVLIGDVDVKVQLSISNTGRSVRLLPRHQLPGDSLQGALFRISRDGQPVDYLGPLVKRGPLGLADHISLAPGQTLSYEVELSGAYELSRNGRYAIEYVGLDKQQGDAEGARELAVERAAQPVYLWLEGRSPQPELTARPDLTPLAGSVSYTGNCTASQKTTLASAFAAATNYSQAAQTYLSGAGSGTQRYKTWFGAYTAARWNTAKAHFVASTDAFKNKAVVLDCSCKQSYYAYVYPTQPYKIYVCNAFWSAPLTGTDSKAGTLVHEMTHFNVVAATDDWAYGHSAAKSLALSNPTKALDNADSHEYFAENTPPLP